jgi:hypothetical protein
VKDQQEARTVGDVLDGSIRGSGKFAFSSVTGHEEDESNIGSIIDHNEDEDKDVDATNTHIRCPRILAVFCRPPTRSTRDEMGIYCTHD